MPKATRFVKPDAWERLSYGRKTENRMHPGVLSCYLDNMIARKYLRDIYLEFMENLNIRPVPFKVLYSVSRHHKIQ